MEKLRIGPSEGLPERGAVRFTILNNGIETPAFAVRYQGQVRAYVNVCTHREMELDLGEGAFFSDDGRFLACRAHGALYDPLRGDCVGGICRRGATLTPVPVVEEEGALFALLAG